MSNNLPVIYHHMHCFLEGFPHVGYFKSVISTTLRMTVTIKLLNIYYSHTTVDRSYTTI